MSVLIDIQDQIEAALEDIPVDTYIIRIITNHARDIINAAKEIE